MYRTAYIDFIFSTNLKGSKKAASYVKALDLLAEMLKSESFSFPDCVDLWSVDSVERLNQLYHFVLEEAKRGDDSAWNIDGIPKSYLQNGYCSAALKTLQEFLVQYRQEANILNTFSQYSGEESELASKLDQSLEYPDVLLENLSTSEGKEKVREVTVRTNQSAFRKIILKLYQNTCCVTGLDIPAVNRASHIIPWASGKSTRMDPRNGICLSATYDAAFDRNLISLDDDYRMILSKDIKDHHTSESVKNYFLMKEGNLISLPKSYRPELSYLETHRSNGNF